MWGFESPNFVVGEMTGMKTPSSYTSYETSLPSRDEVYHSQLGRVYPDTLGSNKVGVPIPESLLPCLMTLDRPYRVGSGRE